MYSSSCARLRRANGVFVGLGFMVLVVSCAVSAVGICCEAVSPRFVRFRGLISPEWGVYAWVCVMGLACSLFLLPARAETAVLWRGEGVL